MGKYVTKEQYRQRGETRGQNLKKNNLNMHTTLTENLQTSLTIEEWT
jgi:hypothetical protein